MGVSKKLSRRTLLKGVGAAASLALPYFFVQNSSAAVANRPVEVDGLPDEDEFLFAQPRGARLDLWGRITGTTAVRATPGLNQELVAWLAPNTALPLLEQLHAEGSNPNNTLWYRIENGYIYTATVQHMRPYRMPREVSSMDEITSTIDEEPGFWAEVIVPYTYAREEPSGAIVRLDDDAPIVHTYGSVHWVIDVELDLDGNVFYKIFNDKPKQEPVYALARHYRHIQEEEFTAINPGADKHIEVDLTGQVIRCFEGDTQVFQCLTSSGAPGWDTPLGKHAVVYKQPSRYMYSDPEQEAFSDPDFFDLPGVPHSIFFTTQGHAIHGTYWHGDYGRPRSHGCLNVTPEASRWLYRWVEPYIPYSASAGGSSANPGTPIIVT
jgi:lipoprotein-anchoring transpeptidase ErfK/SrfK